jgi:hypothetical protein
MANSSADQLDTDSSAKPRSLLSELPFVKPVKCRECYDTSIKPCKNCGPSPATLGVFRPGHLRVTCKRCGGSGKVANAPAATSARLVCQPCRGLGKVEVLCQDCLGETVVVCNHDKLEQEESKEVSLQADFPLRNTRLTAETGPHQHEHDIETSTAVVSTYHRPLRDWGRRSVTPCPSSVGGPANGG